MEDVPQSAILVVIQVHIPVLVVRLSSMHGRVISARMHDCRLLSRRTPQLQHLGGVVQWQRCTMVELRDDSTTAQHQDHGLRLLRCTMITSSTQCTEVRALNLMRAARSAYRSIK